MQGTTSTPVTLRLILGDQLYAGHSWFRTVQPDVVYLILELHQEATYTHHHIRKLAGFFLAMRTFGALLQKQGHRLCYQRITEPESREPLPARLLQLIDRFNAGKLEYQWPDEYRLDTELRRFAKDAPIGVEAVDSEHFYTDRDAVGSFFSGRKTQVMEYFYRDMRKRHGILMSGGKPLGERWNFDQENRRKWTGSPEVPMPLRFEHGAETVLSEISQQKIPVIGRCQDGRIDFPLDGAEALQQLDYFCEHLLPWFGTYQDAMAAGEHNLFHSRLSFALNLKMITPHVVVNRVLEVLDADSGHASLSQVEGFIRQIIGWREYIRGVYWQQMPEYRELNYFSHDRALPEAYWSGETRMRCMREALANSLDHAYAHHIQRLMVTGNFALLIGVHPNEVDAWYLGVYMDAIEWVQLPNTRGMSQYADGGLLATKPYVSASSYLNRMGNYCQQCTYDRNVLTGPRACPFNSLYWHFLDRHRERLKSNHRMGMMYRQLDRRSPAEMREIRAQATRVIDDPDAW